MSAVGSRDGREIVRALEDLRAKATLERDSEGRYFLKGNNATAKSSLHRWQVLDGDRRTPSDRSGDAHWEDAP